MAGVGGTLQTFNLARLMKGCQGLATSKSGCKGCVCEFEKVKATRTETAIIIPARKGSGSCG